MTRDIRIRSLIKTITWRILASLDTFLIAWLVSGSIICWWMDSYN